MGMVGDTERHNGEGKTNPRISVTEVGEVDA